jgi:hypothetical protein
MAIIDDKRTCFAGLGGRVAQLREARAMTVTLIEAHKEQWQ